MVANWLFNGLFNVFFQILWFVAVKPALIVIWAVEKTIRLLSGNFLNFLVYRGDLKDGLDLNQVSPYFWIFASLSFVLGLLFVTIKIMHSMASPKDSDGRSNDYVGFHKMIHAIKHGLFAFVIILGIPIALYLANLVVSWVTNLIVIAIIEGSQKTSGTTLQHPQTIADLAYLMGAYDMDEVIRAGWSTPENAPSAFLDWFGPNIFEISNRWNVFIEVFGVIFLAVIMVLTALMVVVKVVEIFILFMISPLVAITMIFDEGKRMKLWIQMTFAKILAISLILVSFSIFSIFVIGMNQVTDLIVTNKENGAAGGAIIRSLLKTFVIIGAALAMYTSVSGIVASFVGESVAANEGMNMLKMTGAAGMGLLAAAKIGGKALKFSGRMAGFGRAKGATQLLKDHGVLPKGGGAKDAGNDAQKAQQEGAKAITNAQEVFKNTAYQGFFAQRSGIVGAVARSVNRGNMLAGGVAGGIGAGLSVGGMTKNFMGRVGESLKPVNRSEIQAQKTAAHKLAYQTNKKAIAEADPRAKAYFDVMKNAKKGRNIQDGEKEFLEATSKRGLSHEQQAQERVHFETAKELWKTDRKFHSKEGYRDGETKDLITKSDRLIKEGYESLTKTETNFKEGLINEEEYNWQKSDAEKVINKSRKQSAKESYYYNQLKPKPPKTEAKKPSENGAKK